MQSKYKDSVVPILKAAGQELIKHFGDVEIVDQKSDSAVDVVTKLDRDTEQYIKKELAHTFPDIGFHGEEFGGVTDGTFWLLDPIDGTVHFIRGVPVCSIMLTLIHDAQVVFSAVYMFPTDTMYLAEKGRGSWRDAERIHVSERSIEEAYIAVEIDETVSEKNKQLGQKLRERAVVVKTITSGYEFGLVADGRFEGRIQVDPYGGVYDFAVGSLLVSEAGGVVANIGKPAGTYDYTNLNFLATNKKVFQQLTEGPNALFPITK